MASSPLDMLIIEDKLESGFMIEEMLKRARHARRRRRNEAVRLASTQLPNVILMDINTSPYLGGFEAANGIKMLMPQVESVGISGMDIPGDTDGEPAVLDARLHKPFRPEELLRVLVEPVETGGPL